MVLDAPPLENSPTRILIIDTAWIGDVIFTTSLIGAVRRLWPASALHVITALRGEPILRDHPQVDHLWIFDKHGQQRSLPGMQKWAKYLREISFDLILNAHPSFRSRLLTRLIGAPRRIGYKGFGASLCLTHAIPNNLAVEPDHVLRRIALLRALDIEVQPEPLRIALSQDELTYAERILSQHTIGDKPLLGLIPGSAWATKKWSDENYADLLKKWVAERNGGVIVVGGFVEATTIESLHKLSRERVIPLLNEPLPRVAAFLSKCEAVVGNDTGISFMAIAAGVQRVFVLYGCTQVNYSFATPHRAITAGVPCCLPRTGHGAHRCKWAEQPWCMEQITVDRVWNALNEG